MAKECGYRQPCIANHMQRFQAIAELGHYPTSEDDNVNNSRYIDETGVKILVTKSRLMTSVRYAKNIVIELAAFKVESAEMATIGYLTTIFDGDTMEEQFSVGNFRIDLYFTKYKIAVECDEHDHQNRDAQYEYGRQQFITEQLGCRWVRFDPHHKTFSMAKVANHIFRAIMLTSTL